MKILLVNGSPHKRGCTHTALALVGEAAREAGVDTCEFWIGNKPISGCIACGACSRGEGCCIKDRVGEFLEVAGGYDGYVFGSPVHFAGPAGNMKSFMDRAFFSNSYAADPVAFALKPAACVVSARRGGTTAALEQLDKYLEHQQMLMVGSRYWNMVHGNTAEEVMRDEEGVQVMRVLGANLAWAVKAAAAADAAGMERPAPIERRVSTNFIR